MKMATMKFEFKEQVLSYDKPNLKLESDIAISHNILSFNGVLYIEVVLRWIVSLSICLFKHVLCLTVKNL